MDLLALDAKVAEEFLRGMFGSFHVIISKLLLTFLFFLPLFICRKVILRRIPVMVEELNRRYLAVRTVNYATSIISVVIVLTLWMEGGKSFATYIGIISAGFAVALQAPISNMAAWIFISVKKPFIIGDRIELGQMTGDVVDLGLFNFSLLEVGNWCDGQSTGRITHVPNGKVFTQSIHNFTAGFSFIWNELDVSITYESNWQKAKDILGRIVWENADISVKDAEKQVRMATQKYMLNWRYLSPIVWTAVSEKGVVLTMRYLCDPRKKRGSENGIWEAILREFREHDDIEFAYRTTRFFSAKDESTKPLKTF